MASMHHALTFIWAGRGETTVINNGQLGSPRLVRGCGCFDLHNISSVCLQISFILGLLNESVISFVATDNNSSISHQPVLTCLGEEGLCSRLNLTIII